MLPQAVVFDIGKVLLDFDYRIAARAMTQHCPLDAEAIRHALDQSPLLHDYETGLIGTEQFFERVKAGTGFRGGLELFREMFADIFTPIEAVVALHGELHRRGVPTFIFSNTNEIAVGHMRRRFPFFAKFQAYIFSYEERAMKPAPRIYEAVERATGRRGGELFYIDDRPENVEAGAARGWQSVHYVRAEDTLAAVRKAGLL